MKPTDPELVPLPDGSFDVPGLGLVRPLDPSECPGIYVARPDGAAGDLSRGGVKLAFTRPRSAARALALAATKRALEGGCDGD